ncbi:MAG: T9SS type A sorting domain-containing protein [Flavobacteriaceae bacterium]
MKNQVFAFIIALVSFSIQSQEFGINDFRISNMGTDGVTSFFALDPAVAYNTTDNKYLVVWNADDNRDAVVDNEFEIYGQFINADGSESGSNDFRISFTNTDGNTSFRTDRPDVTWNSTTNQFLVVWEGETSVDGEIEIYGQLVNADGTLNGSNFRISDTGPEGDGNFDANRPSVVYNLTDNEFLVVWESDETINNNIEIYGQRISATGNEIGTNDFQISIQLPINDANFDAREPDVVWNSASNQYLVIWQGETSIDEEKEIYGQRLDNSGNAIGSNFRISDMGTEGETTTSALSPRLDYNSVDNNYLIIWQGSDTVANQYETYGQLIDANGAEIGTNDFRITTTTNINANYDTWRPKLVWNVTNNEYLVVYRNDHTTDDEFEIYGQLIDNLGSLKSAAFNLSDMGPDGDTNYGADDCVVATNGIGDYIIAWEGDDNISPLVDNEKEIFIQMFKNETLSITNLNLESELKIYPNPSSSYIYFNKNLNNRTILIVDINGRLIKKAIVSDNYIDIRFLKQGIYFLKYENAKFIKFIKN